MTSLAFLLVTLAALAISHAKDRERTAKALRMSYRSFVGLVPSLLGILGLVGLVMALTPPELLADLFKVHGLTGFALISLVGAIAIIPGPIAFPLAGSLLELGASPSALAAFITTLTMVGLVSVPMEIEYFGRRFTILRQVLSFILAVSIGGLMGVLL